MMLSSYIDLFPQVNILCIGDMMLDHFVYGDINRISPEAPVPVFNSLGEKKMLGGAGNVVANCAALGCRVNAVCVLGEDEAGRFVRETLGRLADRTLFLHSRGVPTIEKTRIIAGNNHIIRIDSEKKFSIDLFADPQTEQTLETLMAQADVILLSDYLKGVLAPENCRRIISLARENGKKVLVDPKGNDYARYAGAFLVKPNLKELSLATGITCRPEAEDFEDELLRAAGMLFSKFHMENLIITLSEHGMAFVSSAKPDTLLHISTEGKEVCDVSGAGDTCLSVLGAALAAGAEVKDAMKLANTAAGIVVGKVGTATVTGAELKSALSRRESSSNGPAWKVKRKIISREEAQAVASEARAAGKKVGFTNGCFDLLHYGHLSSFMQAREYCDLFIVGLNTDASVRRLKGESRPVQDEKSRSLLLASLEMVDFVVLFNEDTALPLVEAIRPDVILKEGYSLDRWPEGRFVESCGGKAVALERMEGYSTTSLVSRIKGQPQ
ncbi:bifunctional heptose 7-phosphate kinase/heptose 1-phosphate adenyltransferase [Mailhella massiliensis]|uniref:Bifunctional protein HldE n=1 Tax=Mailhella massiliensis TaxID=1903261 RepID=A0A921AVX8_9BACT|nr:bifunctional heptose 7-phosphate kinase/heptose 1-phosphate adenyltransferase [Mailhella massiliensis]HJD96931.1 bifunctional heptose 7-phosphate kinase/heptose 1-phosphate adenyltransferase [Mailhella massiliensis]